VEASPRFAHLGEALLALLDGEEAENDLEHRVVHPTPTISVIIEFFLRIHEALTIHCC
jgi:hypothetical protein